MNLFGSPLEQAPLLGIFMSARSPREVSRVVINFINLEFSGH
jgi:hypothetical protein